MEWVVIGGGGSTGIRRRRLCSAAIIHITISAKKDLHFADGSMAQSVIRSKFCWAVFNTSACFILRQNWILANSRHESENDPKDDPIELREKTSITCSLTLIFNEETFSFEDFCLEGRLIDQAPFCERWASLRESHAAALVHSLVSIISISMRDLPAAESHARVAKSDKRGTSAPDIFLNAWVRWGS